MMASEPRIHVYTTHLPCQLEMVTHTELKFTSSCVWPIVTISSWSTTRFEEAQFDGDQLEMVTHSAKNKKDKH